MELPREGCTSPLKNEKIQKLYIETENNKRAKMDFKAFYYAVTVIGEKVYPDLTPNRALIEFTKKVIMTLCNAIWIERAAVRRAEWKH